MNRVAFFLHRADMWDSVESVWRAAREDKECEAFLIPVPYYEINSDGTFGEMYYEGDIFPQNVEITDYNEFDSLIEEDIDIAFICEESQTENAVFFVDPFFSEENLSKYIKKIIKIKDEFIKDSPKLDRIYKLSSCEPVISGKWTKMICDRRVYFYETNHKKMLSCPDAYLEKMNYIFEAFRGRADACLLWREDPLFDSAVRKYLPDKYSRYREIKSYYIDERIGIYDEHISIDRAFMASDVYIGDAGTNSFYMFGIAGKPLFILDTFRYKDVSRFKYSEYIVSELNSEWVISNNQSLFHSARKDYDFKQYYDFSNEKGSYNCVFEIDDSLYICPRDAYSILRIKDKEIAERIEIEVKENKGVPFKYSFHLGKYIFVIPEEYPSLVSYNIDDKEIKYVDVFDRYGIIGAVVWNEWLVIARKDMGELFMINGENGDTHIIATGLVLGTLFERLEYDHDERDIWAFSAEKGMAIRLNLDNEKIYRYDNLPARIDNVSFMRNRVYFYDANRDMSVCLDVNSGELFSDSEFRQKERVTFDMKEIEKLERGFSRYGDDIPYACKENSFNTLEDFLYGRIAGAPYDKRRQLKAYANYGVIDGSCGRKFYRNSIKECTDEE